MSPKLLSKLLRLIPLRCAICELESKTGIGICEICIAQLPWIESACYQCGLPLDGRLLSGGRCARCIIKRPEFDSCQALFHYKPPLARAAGEKPELLLTVPLHRKRMDQRGFNQAWELTQAVSEASGNPSCNSLI